MSAPGGSPSRFCTENVLGKKDMREKQRAVATVIDECVEVQTGSREDHDDYVKP